MYMCVVAMSINPASLTLQFTTQNSHTSVQFSHVYVKIRINICRLIIQVEETAPQSSVT